MAKGKAYKWGGAVMAICFAVATAILPNVIPTKWSIPILVVTGVGILIGAGLWVYGLKRQKAEYSNLLEDIKSNLITINECEREIANEKSQQQYTEGQTKKVRADFTAYITKSASSLLESFANMSKKEQIIDTLIKFFVDISDILDINGYGLKSDLSHKPLYNDTKGDIAKKQQRLNKKKKIMIQNHIRKVDLLMYGLNSALVFRHIYRSVKRTQNAMPLKFNLMLESIERVAEKILTEMLNNLDTDWDEVIKIDFDEI